MVSLILEGELNDYVWNGGDPAWKVANQAQVRLIKKGGKYW